MTSLFVGHPVPLDAEAAGLVEEFGRVWLVSGYAVCGEDRSALEPVMSPADRALYVCLTGAHSWSADEVDAEAWRRLLASGDADHWRIKAWRLLFLDTEAHTAADVAAPEDRRRIMAQASPRWAVEPIPATVGAPPMVLRIHTPAAGSAALPGGGPDGLWTGDPTMTDPDSIPDAVAAFIADHGPIGLDTALSDLAEKLSADHATRPGDRCPGCDDGTRAPCPPEAWAWAWQMDPAAREAAVRESMRAAIREAEAVLMRHAPDPRTGLCPTDRVCQCPGYAPAARRLGELRDQRDHRSAEEDPTA